MFNLVYFSRAVLRIKRTAEGAESDRGSVEGSLTRN
jgi:hypothetical protein